MGVYDTLKDYEPEVLTDNYDVIKGRFDCLVASAQLQDYEGENENLIGEKIIKLDMIIKDGQKYAGRHFFKSFYPTLPGEEYMDKKTGQVKQTKSGAQKTADFLWTCGIKWAIVPGDDAATENNLVGALTELVDGVGEVSVRAAATYMKDGAFVSKKEAEDGGSILQRVSILGKVKAGVDNNPGNNGSGPAF